MSHHTAVVELCLNSTWILQIPVHSYGCGVNKKVPFVSSGSFNQTLSSHVQLYISLICCTHTREIKLNTLGETPYLCITMSYSLTFAHLYNIPYELNNNSNKISYYALTCQGEVLLFSFQSVGQHHNQTKLPADQNNKATMWENAGNKKR